MTDTSSDISTDDSEMVLVRRASIRIGNSRLVAQERDIYFLQARTLGLIKIGVATNASSRLRGIQAMCPDGLKLLGLLRCANYGKTERDIHSKFASARAHGEWFHPTDDLIIWILQYAESNTRRVRAHQLELDLPVNAARKKSERRRLERLSRWA